jgi:hypothetical protein
MIRFGSLLAVLSVASIPLEIGAADIEHFGKLEVHEWGTFTSIAGPNGMAESWQPFGGPTDLPCFVHRFEMGAKASLAGTVRMETPVIYFYAPAPVTARIHVTFPQGFITEWYPRATQVARYLGSGIPPRGPEIRQPTGKEPDSIEWPQIRIDPFRAAPKFPFQFESSHYYAARSTDAAPLVAGDETEKFLFYRGVGQFQPPISAQAGAGDQVSVKNLSQDELAGVILFENRDGKIRYQVQGAVKREAAMELPAGGADLDSLMLEMERFLTAHGLFAKEAHAMVETWRDSWFEDGTRVFYILPRSAVDSILPLDVEPRPERMARVFVGRVEVFTTATKRIVAAAIEEGDRATLEKYSRFLEPLTRTNRDVSQPWDIAQSGNALNASRMKYVTASNRCGKEW